MSKITDLKRERAEFLAKAEDIHNKAKKEDRDTTTAESEEFQMCLRKAETLAIDIEEATVASRGGRSMAEIAMDSCGLARADGAPSQILTKEQRFSDLYHEPNEALRNLDLGRLLGCALGQNPKNSEREKRALNSLTDAAGGIAVPLQLANSILDLARAKSVCQQLGAITVPMTSAELTLPMLENDPTMSWKAEAAEAGVDATCSFGALKLAAKTAIFLLKISSELWADATNRDAALRQAISSAAAVALDRVALMGSGAGSEPVGLYYDANIIKTAVTDADCYTDLAAAMLKVENANYTPTGIAMSPRSYNALRTLVDGESRFVPLPTWLPKVLTTTSIPNTLSSTKSAAFVGQWDQLVFGIRSELRLEILKELYAGSYQIGILGALRADVGCLRSSAFQVVSAIEDGWKSE